MCQQSRRGRPQVSRMLRASAQGPSSINQSMSAPNILTYWLIITVCIPLETTDPENSADRLPIRAATITWLTKQCAV